MSYKIKKAVGLSSDITLINDETNTSYILSTRSRKLADIVKAKLSKGEFSGFRDEWTIDITLEEAKELLRSMIPMSKPVRKKKTSEQVSPDVKIKTQPSTCNAYNFLFGYTDKLDKGGKLK